MRIIFRKNQKVVIVTFDTKSQEFDSNYERSKFFRELYGWDQTVPSEKKNYRYRRHGLLDDIPHKKISGSVFIIAMEHMREMEEFFEHWRRKVDYNMIEVILRHQEFIRDFKKRESIL